MIALTKTNWTRTGDPGLIRDVGGLIAGSAYKLKIPVDAMPVTAGPPSVITVPILTQFESTTASAEMWTRVGALTSAGSFFKFWQRVRKHIFLIKADVDSASLEWQLIRIDDPNPPVVLGFGPIVAALNDVVGMRLRCADAVGGIKVQAAVNVNETSWVNMYNAIDLGAAPFIGISGPWAIAFDLQGALAGVGDAAYIDDFTADNLAPV